MKAKWKGAQRAHPLLSRRVSDRTEGLGRFRYRPLDLPLLLPEILRIGRTAMRAAADRPWLDTWP
jgi:hypothetical protein